MQGEDGKRQHENRHPALSARNLPGLRRLGNRQLHFPLSITLTDAVTDNAPPEGILQVLQDLIMKIVDNPVAALMNANYIGILAWAIIIGIALRMAAESTKITIVDISDALTKVVRGIISLARSESSVSSILRSPAAA